MKTSILTIVICLSMTAEFAQSTVPKLYYISEADGKTIVMLNNKTISNIVYIDSVTQLMPDGIVIWGDKSTTVLRPGDCINDSGIVFSERKETDFIGNPKALNHIHMLPEVTVSAEMKSHQSEYQHYTAYMEKLYKQIEKNDYELAMIREKLWTKSRKEATKYRKMINNLEKENTELKIDFDIFVHFGLLPEWQAFRSEMNEDLKPIAQNIGMIKGELF